MDIPEIRAIVARFLLNFSDLAAAALVCKSWNATFTPVLYTDVRFHSSKQHSMEGLVANASRIRHLLLSEIHVNVPSHICTKLKSLEIRTSSSWNLQAVGRLAALVRHNTNIEMIDIEYAGDVSPRSFLKTVSFCTGLRELYISMPKLKTSCVEIILDVAARLEHLKIKSVTASFPESLDKWPCFPLMKKFELSVYETPARVFLELIRKCPGLKGLDWNVGRNETCPASDISGLFKTYCPLVEQLDLTYVSLMDEHFSEILYGCHRLLSLRFRESNFGELAFQSLSRHFASLEKLDLGYSTGLTSTMIQQIMTSCPRLTTFYGTTLDASDILGDIMDENAMEVDTQEQPRDWVCTNLRFLTISICGLEGKPLVWHRKVLQQLARLDKLDTLSLCASAIPPLTSPKVRDGLNLKLEAGLDHLSSLKRLVVFHFEGIWQQMEEQDVRWMAEAWPKLERVMGRLHHDRMKQQRLSQILKDRGISGPC
ncbi:hypothetical protein BGX34_000828 [Mortierella sp. NVP85]|nr:hypothetical protein BGX34_000828 [Mortierella sp. NVP85]